MLYIICNKNSGHGSAAMQKVRDVLTGTDIEYCILSPDRHADHEKLITAAEEDAVLLIGGDGSINHLFNSLPVRLMAPLILMPSGSGNDFARGARIKNDAAKALSVYKQRTSVKKLDAGSAKVPGHQSRRFAVSCGIGYDAGVCCAIEHSRLKKPLGHLGLGKLVYLLLGIRGIFTYKRAGVTLTLQDKRIHLKDLAFLSCHNLPFEGGGFAFAPKADPEDGMLDITAVTAANRFVFFITLLASLLRLHTKLPWVHTYRSRSLQVETESPLPFHTDGEVILNVSSFRVKVLPGFLPVLF